jgi:hypothetical protein
MTARRGLETATYQSSCSTASANDLLRRRVEVAGLGYVALDPTDDLNVDLTVYDLAKSTTIVTYAPPACSSIFAASAGTPQVLREQDADDAPRCSSVPPSYR